MLNLPVGATMPHAYSLFGLTLHSEFPLPELLPLVGDTVADLTIVRGEVGELPGGEAEYSAIEGGVAFWVGGIGRYAILDGKRIVVEAEPGAIDRNVRLYLLGSAIGMSLHQRGLLPLHANAVEIDGKAYAFMGHSGAGKSTLAAWFHKMGYPIIADDVCVVRFAGADQALVSPGLPRLRLWREAMQTFGWDTANFQRSYTGADGIDKYDFPIPASGYVNGPINLGGLFLLSRGQQFAITPVEGVEAVDTVFANTYRGASISMTDGMTDYWQSCVRLVRSAPLCKVERCWGFDQFDQECGALLDYLKGLGTPK